MYALSHKNSLACAGKVEQHGIYRHDGQPAQKPAFHAQTPAKEDHRQRGYDGGLWTDKVPRD